MDKNPDEIETERLAVGSGCCQPIVFLMFEQQTLLYIHFCLLSGFLFVQQEFSFSLFVVANEAEAPDVLNRGIANRLVACLPPALTLDEAPVTKGDV